MKRIETEKETIYADIMKENEDLKTLLEKQSEIQKLMEAQMHEM